MAKNYNTENIKKYSSNVIKCICINIYSIMANKEELERLIELQEANIVLRSETCTTSNIENAEISIATFNMIL